MATMITAEHGVTTWGSAAWLASVEAWADERLAVAGMERTGSAKRFRVRPTATAFEVGLCNLLSQIVPNGC